MRDEAAELESETRELRASLDEHESARHAQTVVHKQLLHALHDAQATVKRLTADNDVAAAESQRFRAAVDEVEASRGQLAVQLDAVERSHAECSALIQRANVGCRLHKIHSAVVPYPCSL